MRSKLYKFGNLIVIAFLAMSSCLSLLSCTDKSKQDFSVEGGPAEQTFLVFANQAQLGVVFDSDGIRGEVTNPVFGSYSVDSALMKMVEDTSLTYTYDARSGVISVRNKSQQL